MQELVQDLNEELDGNMLVGGLAFNAKLPMTCAMRPEGPNQCSESELAESNWQAKLLQLSPNIPLLQDTKQLDAWNSEFGAGHDDLMLYLDGMLYRYLPNKNNAVNLGIYDVSGYMDAKLTNPNEFNNVLDLILNAYEKYSEPNSYREFCTNESSAGNIRSQNLTSKEASVQKSPSKNSHGALYHVLFGFAFCASIVICIVLAYTLIKKHILPIIKKGVKSHIGRDTNKYLNFMDQFSRGDIIDDNSDFEDQIEMKTKAKDEGPDPRSILLRRSHSIDEDQEMSMFVNDRKERLDISEMEKRISEHFEKSVFI